MRYGLNRHRRRHLEITTVSNGVVGLHKWTEQWKINGSRFTPRDIERLQTLAKMDYGPSAVITSISPIV